ncbi:uncharacterized protein N7483_009431 [Penicillium malachiteum]|uniref:uncharacterized protein n=1 Tax=Penicillium malachiteum TaxID=1324776 RepID=UPI002546E893|nr:uncharacterized protein N7483_009431 [Penicillium malachiteum]KAJ5721497.1 hypothetical protein N7483_009431 [Penicillium malachiteum]
MSRVLISDDDLEGLENKVIVITGKIISQILYIGGSSGIGRATAQLCLNLGAKVVIGDLNPPSSPFENDENLKFLAINAAKWESLREMFAKTVEWFGRIDHVYANAGIPTTPSFLDVKLDEAGKLEPPPFSTLDLNFTGTIYTIHLANAYMTELAPEKTTGTGSIVLASSEAAFRQMKGSDYIISKHGVLGMVRGLTDSLKEKGIRLNAVAPSWTDTKLISLAARAYYKMKTQTPEVVARSVVLLFVDQSRCGNVLYSKDGIYQEINMGKNGLLEKALQILFRKDDEFASKL